MSILKHINKIYFILITMLIMSCSTPRRLYLSNKTDKTITLQVDNDFVTEKGTIQSAFKDALNGKRIEASGHIIINFGAGKWNTAAEKSLKNLLQNISVIKEGNAKNFRLPNDIHIGHGLFIPELIIKIDESLLEQKK